MVTSVAFLCGFSDEWAGLERSGDQIALLLVHSKRCFLGLDFDRVLFGHTRKVLKLLSENRVAAFQVNDAFPNARKSQLASSDLNRQFLAGFGAFAGNTGNLFRAGTLAAEQFERMANLRKFEVGGRGANDHGVARVVEFDLLACGAILGGFQLSAER